LGLLGLGRNADALRVSKQAADTISTKRDALAGPISQIGLAQIEARAAHLRKPLTGFDIWPHPAGSTVSIAALKMTRSGIHP